VKICILSYNYAPYIGGIETYSNNLVKYFRSNKISYKLISGRLTGIKIIRILEVIIRSYIKIPFNNYDIIHLTNLNLWPVLLLNIFKRNKLTFVINLHGLEIVYGNRKKLSSRLYDFLMPYKYISNQDNIYFLCNSTQTLSLAKEKFISSKLNYIPMGVDKIINFDSNKKINKKEIFYFGRIVKRKGLNWFCENILVRLNGAKLYFAGPIVDKEEFRKVNSHPQTEYLGIISEEEKVNRIQGSLFTIIPNIIENENKDFEGFGISLIEVIANGGLPIATKTQGIITSSLDGKIGITIEANDTDQWIDKIQELNTKGLDYRNTLIIKSQNLVQQNFIWNNIFSSTVKFYESIINKN